MKQTDPVKVIKNLRKVQVRLPHHQNVLRHKLMNMQVPQLSNRRRLWLMDPVARFSRTSLTAKKLVPIGLAVVVMMAVVASLFIFRSRSLQHPAKQLVVATAKKVAPVDRAGVNIQVNQTNHAGIVKPQQEIAHKNLPIPIGTVIEPSITNTQMQNNAPAVPDVPSTTPAVGPAVSVIISTGVATIDLTVDGASDNPDRDKKDKREPKNQQRGLANINIKIPKSAAQGEGQQPTD